MSLADACLVRMTEIGADAVILTTDADFLTYRRHSRQVVPCVTPHDRDRHHASTLWRDGPQQTSVPSFHQAWTA